MHLLLSITFVRMRAPGIVYIFGLYPRISYFLKEHLLFIFDNNVRNKCVRVMFASYYEIVFLMALLSSQSTEIYLYFYDKHIVE